MEGERAREEEEEGMVWRWEEGLHERLLRDLRDCTSSRSAGGKWVGLTEKVRE